MYKFDLIVGSIPLTFLIMQGGIVPLIASLLSILWVLTRFLHYIEVSHDKSFKKFFKWVIGWLKKN